MATFALSLLLADHHDENNQAVVWTLPSIKKNLAL
jgi:hypothetical protein